MKKRLMFLLVSALGMFLVGCITIGYRPVGPNEQNPVLHDVKGLIGSLPTEFTPVRIKGTCDFGTAPTYGRVNDHLQGIAKIGNHYILAQSTGNNLPDMKKFLLVSGDGEEKCHFNLVGTTFPHCGGIQACGSILAVAAEPRLGGEGSGVGKVVSGLFDQNHDGPGSDVLFFDFSNPNKPAMLPVKIQRPIKHAGAAGLAYHPLHKCHYVVVYDKDGKVDLYKSNGLSLTAPACKFSLVATFKAEGVSGGGVNLLVEDTGKLYLVGLNRKDGWEQINLNEIKNPGHAPESETVLVKQLTNSGEKDNAAAGFRWGGGVVVKNSRQIDILAASRNLCYGSKMFSDTKILRKAMGNYTKVKWWTTSKWIKVHHKGAYVAKFYLSWIENGASKLWKSGKVGAGYDRMIDLPANAQNINLNAQAMTGLLGKKAWKDIMRCEIPGRQTYQVYGTVFKPKWKAF